jgi:hypothetical protein
MSDRASFARRKMLALGLTAAQGLELVALTTLILWFISMKLILASVAGVFLWYVDASGSRSALTNAIDSVASLSSIMEHIIC